MVKTYEISEYILPAAGAFPEDIALGPDGYLPL
jgi:hypothetical protein